ncbi:hypothetical protein [Candidatus Uabimicrobium amorphum]|uniref:Uncharacterized protein n=1 Tax=Uabimicrobium amorphum TaxID=2596890 RepID=A0A5S9ITM7_UABAM|nr:hypothetical protein [Candidatus Uabimicrobium amorphum]BBM87221.1 hypothetical protein UABAM_05624 [Candidatus Uabimicrobium amorphum]
MFIKQLIFYEYNPDPDPVPVPENLFVSGMESGLGPGSIYLFL